ncbi:hypothetical protein C8F04DRAFT_1268598 [Mycena alexandri]|uniref:Uncharacterized protein n=1 Tax=Mycena alexandri TaxID=1745969 RepID=A0AAD6SIB5_9AGAR|nr:hypothetical protein C8F04DRAFT_1268598 [Mycena alexandri]
MTKAVGLSTKLVGGRCSSSTRFSARDATAKNRVSVNDADLLGRQEGPTFLCRSFPIPASHLLSAPVELSTISFCPNAYSVPASALAERNPLPDRISHAKPHPQRAQTRWHHPPKERPPPRLHRFRMLRRPGSVERYFRAMRILISFPRLHELPRHPPCPLHPCPHPRARYGLLYCVDGDGELDDADAERDAPARVGVRRPSRRVGPRVRVLRPLSALSSSTPYMDLWTAWRVPLTLIPLGLLAVKKHPQPVDDCPCFEDAIAFGSVVLGMYVGQWGAVKWGLWGLDAQGAVMPGSVWVLRNATAAVGKEAAGVVAQWVQVGRRVILTIFAWRLLAKALLHRALPPTFRFLATHVPYPLPHRRFYTPATDNTRVPSRRPRFAPRAQCD